MNKCILYFKASLPPHLVSNVDFDVPILLYL